MKARIFLGLLSTLFIAGCGGLDGQMSVSEKFSLKDRSGKVYEIPTGNYGINLNYNERRDRLTVSFASLNGRKVSIEASTPPGFSIPENGPFRLKAQDYGQTVDLEGSMTTTRIKGEMQWDRQYCTMPGGGPICTPYSCQPGPGTNGYQDVRYYNIQTTQKLEAHFQNPSSGVPVADIGGRQVTVQRHIVSVSMCHY